jgi:hypothetical protein
MARRRLDGIALLLAAAFALNAAALFLPFLEMDVVLAGTDVYSLPRSVGLMWDSGLYAIAILVVLFSVCFPFFKLAQLWRVHRGAPRGERAERALRFVERFGKWSMLDVWIVCLLIGLADDQFFVSTTPRVGLSAFLAAIVLGMVAGEVLAARHLVPDEPRAAPRKPVLVLAALVHAAAIATPFVAVDSFWLADNDLSVVGMARALSIAGWAAWAPALAVAAFLVVAPIGGLVARWRGSTTWAARFERFTMLDVFAFALAIFLVEGDAFVPTELRGGALYLIGAVGAFFLLQRVSSPRAAPAG